MITDKQIEKLAEQAAANKQYCVSSILYSLSAAMKSGNEKELMEYTATYSAKCIIKANINTPQKLN